MNIELTNHQALLIAESLTAQAQELADKIKHETNDNAQKFYWARLNAIAELQTTLYTNFEKAN